MGKLGTTKSRSRSASRSTTIRSCWVARTVCFTRGASRGRASAPRKESDIVLVARD
jgi:hypothetical protein